MDLKTIKQICELQGIEMKLLARVKCPRCDCKTLLIDLKKEYGHCYKCSYNAREEHIRTIAEDDFLYRKKKYNNMMTSSKGISY